MLKNPAVELNTKGERLSCMAKQVTMTRNCAGISLHCGMHRRLWIAWFLNLRHSRPASLSLLFLCLLLLHLFLYFQVPFAFPHTFAFLLHTFLDRFCASRFDPRHLFIPARTMAKAEHGDHYKPLQMFHELPPDFSIEVS
jgi:hypothetical protein